MKLYALHDVKAQSFTAFHVVKSDAVATRDFAQAVLEPKSMIGKYPQDFQLVCLASIADADAGARSEYDDQFVQGEFRVVVTAQQVLDLQPKAGAASDPAQLALLKEA